MRIFGRAIGKITDVKEVLHKRRWSALSPPGYRLSWLALCGVLTGLLPDQPASADEAAVDLRPQVAQSLLQHPEVAEANARVCQAIHRLGLSKAEARPQFGLSISGGRQIAERIKGQNGRPDNRGPSESGRVNSFLNLPDEEISGAHKRDYAHRSRDHIYDGTLSLRYTLLDWGQSKSSIEAQRLRHRVAQIDAQTAFGERSFQLLALAMQLTLFEQVLATQQETAEQIAIEVGSIEARTRAGAGRLSELREAKLLLLDAEIDINRTMAQRDQLIEQLKFDYDLETADAAHLFTVYKNRRPEPIKFLEPADTSRAQALHLEIAATEYEEQQIKGSRYMKVDGVLDGTVFDLADYEDEYELVGRLEFRMPLYDGGTARARLNEIAWRGRELKSAEQTHQRQHAAETERGALRFHQLAREIEEEAARLDELQRRRASIEARQGQTVVSPLEVANLHRQVGNAEARYIQLQMEREEVRSRALFLAEELPAVLGLNLGDDGC